MREMKKMGGLCVITFRFLSNKILVYSFLLYLHYITTAQQFNTKGTQRHVLCHYHSKCLNPCYEPTEESRWSLLKPILGA
jgi:hypothetical protein